MTVAPDQDLGWFSALEHILHVERIDGVPVIHIGAPGPVRAGLVFRVGVADEALPQRGLTHLIEHLALYGHLTPVGNRNGSTGSTITQFIVSGTEEQVVAYLNHVCGALRELPTERMKLEKSILRVEAKGRGSSPYDRHLDVRFGADGLARGAYREFAIDTAETDEVLAWARRWFVRGNVAAWITTDRIPAGLDLRLPEGERRTFVTSPTLVAVRPAWFEGYPGAALVDAVVPRSAAAVLFTAALNETLFRQLRIEHGFSYVAGAQYEPLDAHQARISIYADAADDETSNMVGALADTLSALRDGEFDETDVARAREQKRERAREIARSPESLLGAAAYGFLLGGEPNAPGDLWESGSGVTDAQLTAVASAFWDDAIWQTPTTPDRAIGVGPIPVRTGAFIGGISYSNGVPRERVVLGDSGVSVVTGERTDTVLFEECALAVRWDDGGRLLIGRDGVAVSIEPTMLVRFGHRELHRLDAAIPHNSVVRLPARAENAIPQMPLAATPRRGLGVWAVMAGVPTLALAAMLLGIAVDGMTLITQPGQYGREDLTSSVSTSLVTGIVFLVVGAAFIWAWVRRLTWAYGRRPKRVSP
ncbi:insulinase family protein [Lacisediminihabitans sp.]|jgi:hypothetical protein|uniref:insulinase family protein n=1 Tax=Lacisediminihabitans sp. TaxID=2787631 RepID=UPI002F95FACC